MRSPRRIKSAADSPSARARASAFTSSGSKRTVVEDRRAIQVTYTDGHALSTGRGRAWDGRQLRRRSSGSLVTIELDRAMVERIVRRTRKSMLGWFGRNGYLADKESAADEEPDGLEISVEPRTGSSQRSM